MDLSCPLWGTATEMYQIFLIFGLEIIENAQELSQFWFGNDEKICDFWFGNENKVVSLHLILNELDMFTRIAINYLRQWANKEERKPLVLRGARQVGKTTLINSM